MKAVRNKLLVELRETVLVEKPSAKEEFAKAMGKNLTTLEVIGLAALIMFPLGLFLEQQTDDDSLSEKYNDKR